jgi:hypothetical protein
MPKAPKKTATTNGHAAAPAAALKPTKTKTKTKPRDRNGFTKAQRDQLHALQANPPTYGNKARIHRLVRSTRDDGATEALSLGSGANRVLRDVATALVRPAIERMAIARTCMDRQGVRQRQVKMADSMSRVRLTDGGSHRGAF